MNRIKIKLNHKLKLEALIQETYDEICRHLIQIQNNIELLEESTTLKDETIDGKAKFAKAMNDFMTQRNQAITKKLDICKLLTEILKRNGDVEKTISEVNNTEMPNLGDIFEQIKAESDNEKNKEKKTENYSLKK